MGPLICFASVTIADAATADKDYYLTPPLSGEWKIIGATWTPDGDGAVAVDAAETRTITLKKGSTAISADLTTDSDGAEAAYVAGTPQAFSITGTGLNLEFTGQTDAVKIASVHTGSTGKVAKGVVQIAWEKLHQSA